MRSSVLALCIGFYFVSGSTYSQQLGCNTLEINPNNRKSLHVDAIGVYLH